MSVCSGLELGKGSHREDIRPTASSQLNLCVFSMVFCKRRISCWQPTWERCDMHRQMGEWAGRVGRQAGSLAVREGGQAGRGPEQMGEGAGRWAGRHGGGQAGRAARRQAGGRAGESERAVGQSGGYTGPGRQAGRPAGRQEGRQVRQTGEPGYRELGGRAGRLGKTDRWTRILWLFCKELTKPSRC